MNWLHSLLYGDAPEVKEDSLQDYNDSLFLYETALKILNTKLDIIRSEYDREKAHSDIQSIKYRIKEVKSISRKLEKQGLEFNLQNVQENLNDVVGARIVCLTEDDVYDVVTMIKNIPSIRIVNEKNYIATPKESGYRSYHIIVEIDVPLMNGTFTPVRCEIQVRTLLMDAWSSLEHEIIYKNKNCSKESKMRLRDYSYALSTVEKELSRVRRKELFEELKTPVKRDIDINELKRLKEFFYIYEAAGRILESDIDIVKAAYDKEGVNSDIQSIKYRTKEIESIDRKLLENGLDFKLENIRTGVKDVIAARVVCLDIDDLNRMVELFKSFPGINIVEVRDYLNNPKDSGYRAIHLIIDIHVELAGRTEIVRTEIQFRTLLMDAWAALEHETIYKNSCCSDESRRLLQEYGAILSVMDRSMLDIKRTEIDNLVNGNTPKEESVKKKTKKHQ